MKAGQNHTLTVTRISDYGLYLADQEGQEVLLPNRYVSLADKVGDAVDVFVYHDSEATSRSTSSRGRTVSVSLLTKLLSLFVATQRPVTSST